MEISSLQICFFWYNKSVANQWARSSDGSASGPVICPTFRGRNSDGCHPVHICKFLFVLITTKISYGRLAQLGERSVRNAEVVGSIPISSTIGRLAICKSAFLCCDIHNGLFIDPLLLTFGGHRSKLLKGNIKLNFQCVVPVNVDGLNKLGYNHFFRGESTSVV